MDNERLKILLDKFREGHCTAGEQEEVMQWYRQLNEGGDAVDGGDEGTRGYIDAMYDRFMQKNGLLRPAPKGTKKKTLASVWKAAAVLVVLVALGTAAAYIFKGRTSHVQLPGVVSVKPGESGNVAQNRYVKLSDGSVVILRAGSNLEMDTNTFNRGKREVTLTGEAYFDVFHNPDKPFIIHTGHIKTTVLGTAFNINAIGNQVAVTVTRGKVRVEDTKAHKVLAILRPDQQVTYNIKQENSNIRQLPARPVTQWITREMQFDNSTFGQVAEVLSRRYGVTISFANPAVKNCRVTVTGAFEGTEPVDKVLNIICAPFNCTYTQIDKHITVDGEGCPAS